MDEKKLTVAAQGGDRTAFDDLVRPHMGPLRSYILRMVAHADDTEELMQDTLVKAHQKVSSFRGDASFKTWLFSIATRNCVDHLRKKKRWSVQAQMKAENTMYDRQDVMAAFAGAVAEPEFAFSVREHIAFCFSCVGRSLEPEQQAVLMLREVFEFKNREAAKMLGMSESVFRHHLADARKAMQVAFDGLCALVNKKGVCHQCSQLRDQVPEPKRGDRVEQIGLPEAPRDERFDERLKIVRDADLDNGATAQMHKGLFAFVGSLEGDVDLP